MRIVDAKFSKKIISISLVCFLSLHLANAQKTTIKHSVIGNENLTQIAERYNVTEAEIEALNPTAVKGIKENDVLIIPTNKNISVNSQNIRYTVNLGDTKYSLSKKFGISIKDLETLNPQIVAMLKVGEELTINSNSKQSDIEENTTTYKVKSGDTKFGLSKNLGMPIEMLEKLNPHIVPTLMVGQILFLSTTTDLISTEVDADSRDYIEISSDSDSNDEFSQHLIKSAGPEIESQITEVENNSTSFNSHVIQPGETLYGLSKKAGMSIDAFLILNPKLSASVQSGMVIKMPNPNFKDAIFGSVLNTGKLNSDPNYADLTKTLNSEKTKHLTFFLPFSENEFRGNDFDIAVLSDYERMNRDFFRGALIAIDSIKSIGLNVNFEIVNTENAKLASDLLNLAKSSGVKSSDAIILPNYQKNLDGFAAMVVDSTVPIITTSTILENSTMANLYEAIPSVEVHRHVMLEYLSSMKDANLIVINDEIRSKNQNYILSNSSSIKFLKVNENGTFNAEELIRMFQKNSKNYVILDTDKNGVFIGATNILLREMSNFKIQLAVLEPSLIPDEDDVSRKRFVILDMIYPSIMNLSPSGYAKIFRDVYKHKYGSEPVTMAGYGFDITFDTLLRLFQSESFEESAKKNTRYSTLKIEYSKNEKGYYSNFGVSIFQYESNDQHIQVK